jgi:hypothetical protein
MRLDLGGRSSAVVPGTNRWLIEGNPGYCTDLLAHFLAP